ncbi:hypothetical protein IGS67_00105 [Flavimobilis sp. GY10621]|uniref:Tubulin like n=1 Tax=Flavimobilis rhizosphaerae TaxID=2775421 RepID=A0ABR9DLX9_9MICO|nr:tubulin-like doman-containing protein [Flavimobilis rhizosphaerae]MBD9697904.1 hypothetical protein [Flavimobilis rhizosphaerae]
MLQPFLLIGVGGSGGKTLRVVRADLQRRLAQAGWTGDLPRAWQFLHIDVPTVADGDEADLPPQLPAGQYQGLVAEGLDYRTIDSALAGAGMTNMTQLLTGYRPDPTKVTVSVSKGAGQYRTLGRMITVASLDKVSRAITGAMKILDDASVVDDLIRVSNLLGSDSRAAARAPMAVVVASIAGGSGAGAIIDVCDALRATGTTWASDSVGVLYAPDVFSDVPPEKTKGVRPNALGCLSEILAGYWNSDGPSPETVSLLKVKGIVTSADRLGPRFPFLVGSRNDSVAFGRQNDIYRAMGRSLASWMTSDSVQSQFGDYIIGNWPNTAQNVPDKLPLKAQGTETPFSAMGSSRVGLGRDRFRDYAAQAIARRSVERVLRVQEEQRAPDDDRTPKKLIADIAEQRFAYFLDWAELEERGTEYNDILDALRPAGLKDDAAALTAEIHRKIVSEIDPKKGIRRQDAATRILSEVSGRSRAFQDGQKQARTDCARAWIDQVQKHLVTVASRSVATDGAPVTAELLDMVCTELTQVREELENEASQHARYASDLSVVQKGLGTAELLVPDHPALETATRQVVEQLIHQEEANLRDLAVELIPDLVANFLKPLANAVRNVTLTLEQEELPTANGRPSVISTWPAGNLVPERLKPAANEFLVDPVGEFPEELNTLVTRTVGGSSAAAAWRTAMMQVLLGSVEEDFAGQKLLVPSVPWVPRDHNLHATWGSSPTRATFETRLEAADILARADGWVTQPGTAIGAHNSQSLKDYLDPGKVAPDVHARRLERFRGQFIAALNTSAPLVDINASVLAQVHGETRHGFEVFFTEIPFPQGSPGRALVQEILNGRKFDGVDRYFGDGDASSIDLFALLSAPYEPVVFDSIMKPIAQDWGAKFDTDQRAEFWRWRRARPLPEFLPFAPMVRRAMIRGWFTAAVLGQLMIDESTNRVGVFVPTETGAPGTTVDFPHPFLSADAPQAYDRLPVVLISVLLAMVEVNTMASLDPMKPYARLRDLGRSGKDGGLENYTAANDELAAWVLRAQTSSGAPQVPAEAGTADQSVEERKAAIEERLLGLAESFRGLFERTEQRTDPFDVPQAYELRGDILGVLDDLRRAVGHLSAPTGLGAFH